MPALTHIRRLLFATTLVGAAWCHVVILREPPGLVLDGTYLADQASSAWGLLFLCSTLVAWAFAQRYYRSNRAFLGEHEAAPRRCASGGTARR